MVWTLSAKAVVRDGQGRILLIRRSAASRNNAGKWELPGGKVDGGESVEQALQREVQEETGLRVEVCGVAGAAESAWDSRRIAYLIFTATPHPGEVVLSDEHDAFAWVDVTDLASYDMPAQFAGFLRRYLEGR